MFDPNLIKPVDLNFDVGKILEVYNSIKQLEQNCQISITGVDGENVTEGTGSIDKLKFEESSYINLNNIFKGTYIEYMHNTLLEKFAVVRGRFMRLSGKRCYTYHVDPTWRLHIPLIKNASSIFIIDDKVFRLENEGQVYLVNTTIVHSAINMSVHDRLHIVYGLKTV